MIDHTVPIPFDKVIYRIEFNEPSVSLRYHGNRPEDRCHPETKLYEHRDELTHIPEEHHYRCRDPGDPQDQHRGGKKVVEDLYPVDFRHIAIGHEHGEHHKDEEDMHHQGGKQRHDRQEAHSENDLFDQKTVDQDTVGTVGNCLGKEKPGEHSRDQPQDKGKIIDRFGLEAYLEDEPEDQNGDRWLDKSPGHTQEIPKILLFEVIFGQRPQ